MGYYDTIDLTFSHITWYEMRRILSEFNDHIHKIVSETPPPFQSIEVLQCKNRQENFSSSIRIFLT